MNNNNNNNNISMSMMGMGSNPVNSNNNLNNNNNNNKEGDNIVSSSASSSQQNQKSGFSNMDAQTIKLTSDTLKRNPKEFCKTDLLKLLSYLEGELQARDVVIAALKSEKVKQLLHTARFKPLGLNCPHAALFRDNLASSGNVASRQSSAAAAQSEHEIRLIADQQLESLEILIMQQRQTQVKMVSVLKEAEEKYKRVMGELEEERRKHEHDTAQGDDITYGLEIERTRLKQDLEVEKTAKQKIEKDSKKVQETLENERNRQKQIVLLLLAERKKIIVKYIEERKRSEDLAQILSEEKLRVDSIAEGLEEESKKSLRMEEELEKQLQAFEKERAVLLQSICKEQKIVQDHEQEIAQLRAEIELLLKKQGMSVSAIASKFRNDDASPMMSSVAKVVQPTATVSSVPVSGPTTGIALAPGQSLRQSATALPEINTFTTTKVAPRKLSNTPAPGVILSASAISICPSGAGTGTGNNNIVLNSTSTSSLQSQSSQSSTTSSSASSTSLLLSQTPKNSNSNQTQSPLSQPQAQSQSQPSIKKTSIPPIGNRGVPPPIPPNKPVIPPKRESNSRIPFINSSSLSSASTTTSSSSSSSNATVSSFVAATTNLKDRDIVNSTNTNTIINRNTNASGISTVGSAVNKETLDNEIKDFQQVLCSMSNNK